MCWFPHILVGRDFVIIKLVFYFQSNLPASYFLRGYYEHFMPEGPEMVIMLQIDGISHVSEDCYIHEKDLRLPQYCNIILKHNDV